PIRSTAMVNLPITRSPSSRRVSTSPTRFPVSCTWLLTAISSPPQFPLRPCTNEATSKARPTITRKAPKILTTAIAPFARDTRSPGAGAIGRTPTCPSRFLTLLVTSLLTAGTKGPDGTSAAAHDVLDFTSGWLLPTLLVVDWTTRLQGDVL